MKTNVSRLIGDDKIYEFTLEGGPVAAVAITSRAKIWMLRDQIRDWKSSISGKLLLEYEYVKTQDHSSRFWRNGCAARYEDVHCLILDHYLVAVVLDIACHFLSEPTVLPHIGSRSGDW
jgi:hypothetical protein